LVQAPHVDDWKILHQLSVRLLDSHTTTRKLECVLEAVARVHNASMAILSVPDPDRRTLVARASIGMSEAIVKDLSRIGIGPDGRSTAFAEEHQVIGEDLQSNSTVGQPCARPEQHGIGNSYSTSIFNTSGEVLAVLTVYFDTPHQPLQREIELDEICGGMAAAILEREVIESQLRQERDRRNQMLSGMAEGLCVVDHQFRVLEMNAAALRISKRPLEEMLGKSHWELWPETTDSPLGHAYRRAMRERVTVRLENRWTDPQGQTGWFELTAQPIDAGLALYFRDITESRQAQQEVEDSAQRYRILSETVSDLVWRANANGEPIGDTTSWRRYTDDWSPDLRWIHSVHPDDCERVQNAWKRYLEVGEPAVERYRVRRKDGQYRHLESRAVPLKDSDGVVMEWIGTCTDVTDSIMHAEEMRLTNERKDRFLAVLSHELRNPLAATGMAAKLIESPRTTSKRAVELSEVILRQVGHMSRLVEDLIDVSRVTMGLVVLDKQIVDICGIAHDAVEQIRPMIAARKHTLVIDLPVSRCETMGDRTRLVQVLSNLLSNAARYTPDEGNIGLCITCDYDTITASVSDDGIGIPAEALPDLFDFYTQAERSTDRKNGGLGLGLALVKSLVDAHGGRIRISSDGEGMGTVCSYTLPRVHA
jgi:PAS domain S-box-containing protein